jgi:hypothetical protein
LCVPQFAPLYPALHAQLPGGVHRPVAAEAERNAQKNSTAQSVRQAIRRMFSLLRRDDGIGDDFENGQIIRAASDKCLAMGSL